MKTYTLVREQWVPRDLSTVFSFFADAANLGRLTPAWMHFKIRTPLPIEMREGTRIEYTIRLAGVPMRWLTRIETWEPARSFSDVQERGPYALWKHTHEFSTHGDGVLVVDRVCYALPLGPLGRVAHSLAVRATLSAIFDYRYERIRELLGAGSVQAASGASS